MAAIPRAVVTESNGEVSCSTAETNRIRAALGMRPLDESAGRGADSAAAREKAAADAEARVAAAAAAEAAARLQRARDRRALHAKEKGKTLGQQLAAKGATKMSAADWVAQSRAAPPAAAGGSSSGGGGGKAGRGKRKKRRAKTKGAAAAARTAAMLAEQDAAFESGAYTSADLEGLRLQHDLGAFRAGESVVLTLKDRGVLDDGGSGSDGDELVNVNLAEADRRADADREARRTADGDDENGTSSSILPKYDELKRRGGTTIGRRGVAVAAEADAGDAPTPRGVVVPLTQGPRTVGSDYMTKEEEQIQFARRKGGGKRKRLRKKKKKAKQQRVQGGEASKDDDGAQSDGDHGSRRTARGSGAASERADNKRRRREAYDAAVEREGHRAATLLSEAPGVNSHASTDAAKVVKAATSRDKRRALPSDATDGAGAGVPLPPGAGSAAGTDVTAPSGHRVYNFLGSGAADDEDEDEDDAELMASLARARRSAAGRTRKGSRRASQRAGQQEAGKDDGSGTSVLDAVKKLGESTNGAAQTGGGGGGGGGLVFTSTSEFSRQIQSRMAVKRRDDAAAARERAKEAAVAQAKAAVEAARRQGIAARPTDPAPKAEQVADADDDAGPPEAAATAGGDGSTADAAADGAASGAFADEPLASTGMAAALALLNRKGELFKQTEYAGRANDKRVTPEDRVPDDPSNRVIIEHRDEFGRLLTRQEAYRQLCYGFHGIKPSKRKQEKRLREMLEAQKVQHHAASDLGTTGITRALQSQRQSRGQAFVVLSKDSHAQP